MSNHSRGSWWLFFRANLPALAAFGCLAIPCGHAQAQGMQREVPVANERRPKVGDRGTLTGKLIMGYQGWFNCPGDGANLGWWH